MQAIDIYTRWEDTAAEQGVTIPAWDKLLPEVRVSFTMAVDQARLEETREE